MDRRKFIASSIAAATVLNTASLPDMLAQQNYDLVAVKGGKPGEMFDRAIASVGGMGKFVKQGNTVVIKPNIGWDNPPDRATNTHPELVSRIINHCYNAGAKKVYVFDNTCDNWQKSYTNSGIEKAAKDAGAKVVAANSESSYHEVSIPNGIILKKAKVHELILNSDVFINVPILKHHSSAKLTIAMKNLMGIIWDRKFWHGNNLHQCIADMCTFKKPHLNVVDAFNVLRKNGPRGVSTDDVENMKSLLLSTDIVAIDAAAAKLFGINPDEIPYIKIADSMKIGRKDLDKLNINRIKI